MGLFDFLRRKDRDPVEPTGPAEVDRAEQTEVDQADLIEAARAAVEPGFLDRRDAVVAVADYLELELDDARVEQAIDQLWRQRLLEQRSWKGPGDYDRLSRAFDRLAEEGVVGRMNFTCCQNCGTTEIDDERTERSDYAGEGYRWREWGYTFFHQQDAERLTENPTVLYLSFSTFTAAPGVDAALVAAARAGDSSAREQVVRESDNRVGAVVAAALRAEGLEVEWSGESSTRIRVTITDWRKPLPVWPGHNER